MSIRSRMSDRRLNERGAAMVLGAIFFTFLALPLCALSVDTARWWVEAQRVQAAADAAATAGVTYMPEDFDSAKARAIEFAKNNGYINGASGTSITVSAGERPTQLKVSISTTVDNFFAKSFGIDTSTITRSSVADFNGPAPMGSPCNTFGNEPAGSSSVGPVGSALKTPTYATCSTNPQFWGAIAGPETWKDQGSQFETRKCGGVGEDGCVSSASGAANEEYDPRGFIYMIRVTPAAVGQSIQVQLYDPAYVDAGTGTCNAGPVSGSMSSGDNYRYPLATTDADSRYRSGANSFCTGDSDNNGRRFGSEVPTVTSFALREPVDTLNPFGAPAYQPSQCTKQFPGYSNTTSTPLSTAKLRTSMSPDYNVNIARVFHQWVTLCTFTPSKAGDWYLQVRNNVALPSPLILDATGAAAGNTDVTDSVGDDTSVKGNGNNMFAIRAISTAPAGAVSVASWERMRIYANADTATTTFNLVRVVPAAANKTLVFSFFDVGEGASSGSVKLLKPADSNLPTNIANCVGDGVTDGNLTNCQISGITSTNYNGKLQTVRVPIPSTYTCQVTSSGGCWFRVQVSFGSGTVTDATTWTARIEGEPVRLIE